MEQDILTSINDVLASTKEWEWVNVLALGVAILALVFAVWALILAMGSHQAAQHAKKAVTFDERFSVYKDAETFLKDWHGRGRPDLDDGLPSLIAGWSRSQFLFPETVSGYLKTVWDDAIAADNARNIMDGFAEGDDEKAAKIDAKLTKKHVENYDRLRKAFMPHIKVV
jgi:hypothetical protein